MSVRIINTEARQFLIEATKRFEEFRARILELGPYANKYNLPEQKKGIESILPELRRITGSTDFWKESMETPIKFSDCPITLKSFFDRKITGKMYIFRNAFILVNGLYTDNEASLLVVSYVNKHRSHAEHLALRENSNYDGPYERRRIPEQVRSEVWRRDGAKCVQCNSIYNLEFDHIIPLSRGGSNTARNLQLLCENCNRSKSNKI